MTKQSDLDEVLMLTHFAFRAIIRRADEMLARHGLGRVHHRVLFFLRGREPCSVGDLVEILQVSRQALNRPLRDLLRRRFIASTVSADDRRLRLLALTATGRRLESALSGDQRARFAKVFARLGARREQAWRDVMRALAEEAEEAQGPPAARLPARKRPVLRQPGRPPRPR